MSTFHVYVEGATDDAPGAIERLADAMAARYGLPAPELVARMSRGRFRVKANVDRATAESYERDLGALGARTIIEEGVRLQSSPSLQVPNSPLTPAKGLPVVSRTATPLPPAPTRPSNPQFQSGLAAAFASSETPTDLGALGDAATFTLASVDGEGAESTSVGGFEPPPESSAPPDGAPRAAITFKPPSAPSPSAKRAKSSDTPSEFAPPESETASLPVELATDELDYRARKASLPPATVTDAASSMPAMRRSSPSIPAATPTGVSRSSGLLASERARLVLGVVLAIAIGFLPAHVYATMRDPGKAIDAAVIDHQQRMSTLEDYEGLDAFRAEQLDRKKSQQRTTAIAAMLIWAVVGAGLGYVWFRRVPWDRIAGTA